MAIKDRLKLSGWVLPKEDSCIAPDDVWSNRDMDPSPVEDRRWTGWTFMMYWACDLLNPGSWATVSSFVALGLTWWESMLAIFLGSFLCGILITLNGVIGSTIHTPFAVTSRATFGYYGSKFVVFSRMVIAMFWTDGRTVIQLPFIWIHPSKLAWLFNIKAVLVLCVAVATLAWAVKTAGGNAGAALGDLSDRVAPGVPRFLAFCTAVTATMGTWSTLSLNIGDFARYCKRPSAAYFQLWAFPLISTIVSVFAAVSAACCYSIYGEALYQPYLIIAKWGGSSGGRAAMFFAGLIWGLANVTTNITANSISASNDMASLVPKYINIKRGQFIAATIGVWGFAPWKVLASADNFLTFMASYSIVLSPCAALLAFDFFIVHKKRYDIYELYRPDGIYRFLGGWNWRSYIALAVAVSINLPGMINAIQSTVVIGNAAYIYLLSNLTGDFTAVLIYWVLCHFFPASDSYIDEPVHDILDPSQSVYQPRQDMDAYDKKGQEAYGTVEPVYAI